MDLERTCLASPLSPAESRLRRAGGRPTLAQFDNRAKASSPTAALSEVATAASKWFFPVTQLRMSARAYYLEAGPDRCGPGRGGGDLVPAEAVYVKQLLKAAVTQLHMSARAYHRILKLGRTIADLAGVEVIHPAHVAEVVQYWPGQSA